MRKMGGTKMSKRIKSENKRRRLAMKRARKAANQSKYDAMREAGANSKSKRFIRRSKRVLIRKHDHPQIPCGNPGCAKCYPAFAI